MRYEVHKTKTYLPNLICLPGTRRPDAPLDSQARGDPVAVLGFLDRDALHIDARRLEVSVPQGVLRLGQVASFLGHHAREGVAGLVQVDVRDAGLQRVPPQVLDESARNRRLGRPGLYGERLSLREAAEALGVSHEYVRQLILSGELPAEKDEYEYRIAPAEVEAYRARQDE